jgi:hypothetical protein
VVGSDIVIPLAGVKTRLLAGVLVAERGWGGPNSPLALTIEVPVEESATNER